MEVFVLNRIKNTQVLNKFLEEFGKSFNTVSPDYKVKVLKLLSKLQVKNQDVYELVLKTANQTPSKFK